MLRLRHGAAIIALVILLVAAIPATAQDGAQGPGDVPQLYAPSGPHAVGRTTYAWTDTARDEVHTEDPDDRRELSVTVWYPARPAADAPRAPYMPRALAELFETVNGLSAGRLQAIRANAVQDAPLADEPATFPVLVFDPGFSATPFQYTVLLEELASQGYVVFGMSHPYASAMTVYPDGRAIEALHGDRLRSIWAPRNVYDGEFTGAWYPDTAFVVAQIRALNEDDPQGRFTGRLDVAQYGMLGHSQGARTISAVCYDDPRCAAALNMDGKYSAAVQLDFARPYMFMSADNGVDEFITLFDSGLEALGAGYYVLMIPRTHHNSFVDTAFWAPLVMETPPEGTGAAQIALLDYRLYAAAFFDRHLRGLDVPLLDGGSAEHPEVFFLNRLEPVTPPTAGADPRAAETGAQHGTLAIGAADVWHYDGRTGEVLDIMLLADRPADNADAEQRAQYNLLDTLLAVRGPDGALLAANDDMTDRMTNSQVPGLELPADGVYTIEARSWGNATGGGYTLVIEPQNAN